MSKPQLVTVLTSPPDTSAMNSVQLPLASCPVNEFNSADGAVALKVACDDSGLMFRPSGW